MVIKGGEGQKLFLINPKDSIKSAICFFIIVFNLSTQAYADVYERRDCSLYSKYENSCTTCFRGNFTGVNLNQANIGIYEPITNNSDKTIVFFKDEINRNYSFQAINSTVYVSENLFKFPDDMVFYTANSGRLYAVVPPHTTNTLFVAKEGHGIRLVKPPEENDDNEPLALLKFTIPYYTYISENVLSDKSLIVDCVFYHYKM